MQLSPQSASQRHLLLRPLQSSSTRHFFRHAWSDAADVLDPFLASCRRLVHLVALASSASMWVDTRPAPGRFLPRLLPASVSVNLHHRKLLASIVSRDVREWLSTFPFPPIPIYSIPFPPTSIPKFLTYSHSHGIPMWAIPIPSHSHSHLGLVIGLGLALACETTQSSLDPVLLQ